MSTFKQILEAKAKLIEDPPIGGASSKDLECPPAPAPEPAPAPDPRAVTLAASGPITYPQLPRNPHQVVTLTGEPFQVQLDASGRSNAFQPASTAIVHAFAAVDGTRKGYQYSQGIIRPNEFGQYVSSNEIEAEFIDALVTAGILVQLDTAGNKYPIL